MANKTNTKTTYNAAEEAAAKVDEQGILDKFNAATTAQYNVQREQNRLAENQFYNKMYNTQKTAMDTIRQNNAAAVATGASRGVQAANELSALLGLQQESVAGATEVAQAQRQTAQEETAAVLENILKAYQQAEAERQNRRTATIEGASVDATKEQIYLTEYKYAIADGNAGLANAMASQLSAMGYTFKDGVAIPPNADASTNTNTNTGTNTDASSNVSTAPVYTTGKTGTVQTDAIGNLTKSGIDADGHLVFTKKDLDTNNTADIYNVLADAGIKYDSQKVLDLSDSSAYTSIEQDGVDAEDGLSGSAGEYINKIISDANNHQIPVGSRVLLNYGKTNTEEAYEYIYLGGTKFAKVSSYTDSTVAEKALADALSGNGIFNALAKISHTTGEEYAIPVKQYYVPDGYIWGYTQAGAKGTRRFGIYKEGNI